MAALHELAGALTRIAAVEARDLEIAERRDKCSHAWQQHISHLARRRRSIPPDDGAGASAADILELEEEVAVVLEDGHADEPGVVIERRGERG
jgi:hypothetical protein